MLLTLYARCVLTFMSFQSSLQDKLFLTKMFICDILK